MKKPHKPRKAKDLIGDKTFPDMPERPEMPDMPERPEDPRKPKDVETD
ncbi:MAG: hypothetical protein V3R25_05765 [Nitrosomonadaceae bacterium]